ncbi:cell division topological specificity factor MinE [Vulcaniibacterium thermophilum]|jgi:cell division topological specificity factor|uniref:Cell division topological specificity factor n=1 Tax=Vulcaniibacterium thermophilum TaxID=1169913 RepID=A0A918Z225_9GAMM|nr:cell division topological specificity factor MinE [Vulcaniibacterium thermophilum]GHE32869.1 cell division topological specificity factor [Vulcaniibacterium thermophilum]
MGLFDFLLAKKQTASVAKERLRIIVAHERVGRNGPDYLPMLQRELLEVIRKYVNVDAEAVKVDLIGDGDSKVLDISVTLPEQG